MIQKFFVLAVRRVVQERDVVVVKACGAAQLPTAFHLVVQSRRTTLQIRKLCSTQYLFHLLILG